ncbi:MAG: hypothetical protein V3R77_03130 [Candidatus Binatia bacterium]
MESFTARISIVLATLLLVTPPALEAGGLAGYSARGGNTLGRSLGVSSYSGTGGTPRYHYGGYGFSHGRHGYSRDSHRHVPGGHRPYGHESNYLPSHSGVRHYYAPYYGCGHRRTYRSYGHLAPCDYRGRYGYGVYGFTIPSNSRSGPPGNLDATLSERMAPGWELLAEGEAAEAISVFAAASAAFPEAGGPKAGYAIAQAMTGDLPTGVWAMRRALAVDPVGLHYLALAEDLRTRLQLVIDRYAANRLGRPSQRIDGTFMVAALSYLVHDTKGARRALADARGLGDGTNSTENLMRLVDETGAATNQTD